VVELAGLADDDRPGPDQQDLVDVGTLRHGTRHAEGVGANPAYLTGEAAGANRESSARSASGRPLAERADHSQFGWPRPARPEYHARTARRPDRSGPSGPLSRGSTMRRFIGAAVLAAALVGVAVAQDGPVVLKFKKPGPGVVV